MNEVVCSICGYRFKVNRIFNPSNCPSCKSIMVDSKVESSNGYKKLYESLKEAYKKLEYENTELKNKIIFNKNESEINTSLKEKIDNIAFSEIAKMNIQSQKLSQEIAEIKTRLRKYEKVY